MITPSPISRRRLLEMMAVAPLAFASLRGEDSRDRTRPSVPAETFSHSVCRWCFSSIPLETLAPVVKEIGYQSIELLDPSEWPLVQAVGLTCAVANGTTRIDRGFNRIENHAEYVPSMRERIAECAAAGIPNVICFSGNRAGLGDEQGLENCAIGLRQIVAEAERKGVTIVMELLNSKVNHKDYQCDHTAWGVELVKRVGSERFKLLYDIYHMQIMEGDVISTITENHAYIGHYHTAGVPGRHEIDDAQELNYTPIMQAIKSTGFRGYVAQEFLATKDPYLSLKDALRRCRV